MLYNYKSKCFDNVYKIADKAILKIKIANLTIGKIKNFFEN